MKRIFASLVFGITLMSVSAPVLANPTRHSQPRPRISRENAISAYQNRQNRALARQRYSALVQRVVRSFPSRLTITGGGRTHSDYMKISRPSARGVNNWTLPNHCRVNARKCGNN